MQNKIISKLLNKSTKKNQTTKLYTDDDNYLALKVLPLPVKEGESFTVALNEQQAL
jgi:hypothetical protein